MKPLLGKWFVAWPSCSSVRYLGWKVVLSSVAIDPPIIWKISCHYFCLLMSLFFLPKQMFNDWILRKSFQSCHRERRVAFVYTKVKYQNDEWEIVKVRDAREREKEKEAGNSHATWLIFPHHGMHRPSLESNEIRTHHVTNTNTNNREETRIGWKIRKFGKIRITKQNEVCVWSENRMKTGKKWNQMHIMITNKGH